MSTAGRSNILKADYREIGLGVSLGTPTGAAGGVTVYGANKKLAFFAVKGNVATEFPPAYPDVACATTNGDEKYGDPSWSPDGSMIAYESKKGIEVSRFTEFGADHCAAPQDWTITATGSSPDWGLADPPAAAYVAPGPTPTPVPTATPMPAPNKPTASAKLAIAKATAKALRKGLAVSVTVPGAGKVTLTATVAGRKVAAGSASAKKAGTITVKLSKVEKSLKGKTLTLKLRFNGTVQARTLKVR